MKRVTLFDFFARALLLCAAATTVACGGDNGEEEILAPELGIGDHSPASVNFTVIADEAGGLNQPRDLDFNPLRPNEMWVVNYADDSVVIVHRASEDTRFTEKRIDGYALHFMEEVTALDFGQDETTFGKPGTFGTCGESRNTYNGQAAGNDFTGPTLWSSDLEIFAKENPHGGGSHLDMLHNTPLCMGIAHAEANKYWTMGALHKSIDLYDFQVDDGIGNDNHSDGLTWRYAVGELGYEPGVPHHLALDVAAERLYIADPANRRIMALDTASGTEGATAQGFETNITMMDGEILTPFVADPEVAKPAGLTLANGYLYVADNENGRISAFDLETGELVNYLETGLASGALGGLRVGPDGRVYFVDMTGNRVLRIDPILEEAAE